jgi:hypothetical protein
VRWIVELQAGWQLNRAEIRVGLFKQLKEMKTANADEPATTPAPAPGEPVTTRRIATSLDRSRQSPASNGTSRSNADREGQTYAAFGPDFEPIAMVNLELYVRICRGLDSFPDAHTEMLRRAEYVGVSAENWRTASAGWSARIQANPAVEWTFSALYDEP